MIDTDSTAYSTRHPGIVINLFMLHSTEHEISSAHKNKMLKNIDCSCHCIYPDSKYKNATIVGSLTFEPVDEISNYVVCATSKASDQPAHTHSLIRAFASRLSIL